MQISLTILQEDVSRSALDLEQSNNNKKITTFRIETVKKLIARTLYF